MALKFESDGWECDLPRIRDEVTKPCQSETIAKVQKTERKGNTLLEFEGQVQNTNW